MTNIILCLKSEWGTGLQLQEILKFRNKDIRGKSSIEAYIGTRNIKKVFEIPKELQKIILDYTQGKDPEDYLIVGHAGSKTPLSREQAYRVFKNAGKEIGLNSVGAQTMRNRHLHGSITRRPTTSIICRNC